MKTKTSKPKARDETETEMDSGETINLAAFGAKPQHIGYKFAVKTKAGQDEFRRVGQAFIDAVTGGAFGELNVESNDSNKAFYMAMAYIADGGKIPAPRNTDWAKYSPQSKR